MLARDQFHLGVVVADIPSAQGRWSGLLAYEWGMEVESTVSVQLPSGEAEISLRLCYSATTPRIELVRQVPGTLWMPADNGGVHHLGYWSDDLVADGLALEAQGFHHEASGLGDGQEPMWSYHRHPVGWRIELVSRALETAMAALWDPSPQ